jgi:protein-L-isoaspartate(D-aspartate) O-methyltransferase
MTELLKPEKDDVALEVGTGSGYQAAVLSQIVKKVYTMEIVPPLGKAAEKRLKEVSYKNIEVKVGDGYYGWEKHAPFDCIIVTAASDHIPPPLIKQLKKGGKMVIPVGGPFQVQNLMLIEKSEKGEIKTKNILPVRFVPLRRKWK